MSYNGPSFQTRKLRVSLSVIRWISRSSPLEDFQNRGSENPIPETCDGANVRSDRLLSCSSSQGREVRQSCACADSPRRLGLRRLVPRRAGRGSSCRSGFQPHGWVATALRAARIPTYHTIRAPASIRTAAFAAARGCSPALSRAARSRPRPSRRRPRALASPFQRRAFRPSHGILGAKQRKPLRKRHLAAARSHRRPYPRFRPRHRPHLRHRARSL